MDELTSKSLDIYFNALSKLGYKSYAEVDRLLILIFIQELLSSECSSFITEDEYKIIQDTLYCLYGSTCLIPYPEFISNAVISCSGKAHNY